MAIIRNERAARNGGSTGVTGSGRAGSEAVEDVESEEEIDYSWHPNENEYVSPLSADQWAELLGDDSFAQSDAGRAVRCLHEYGEPATFQQLSIRYRGTMGRYRRWLSDAAQTAGERFGVPVPQKNQYGMDEWWPLLYQTRNAGKPGAGIFEMALRPEVEEAFLKLEEAERQAKRAENARQLQRIEQLERARQEERRRAAAPKEEPQPMPMPDPAPEPLPETTPAQAPAPEPAKPAKPAAAPAPKTDGAVSIPMRRLRSQEEPTTAHATDASLAVSVEPSEQAEQPLPATLAFLQLMEQPTSRGARFVARSTTGQAKADDAAASIDYALRYAERLRHAVALMREANPSITLASIARELGDESVERLQAIANGQQIPAFAYLDVLRVRAFFGIERLEAADGSEDALPAFVTLDEALGIEGACEALASEGPKEISYIVDDSDDRRTGVIVRLTDVRCALLTRGAVRGAARRGDNAQLEAFIRMVDELDSFARVHGVLRTSRQVTAAEWDTLVAGGIWPGSLLA